MGGMPVRRRLRLPFKKSALIIIDFSVASFLV